MRMFAWPRFIGRRKDALIGALLVVSTLAAGSMMLVPHVTGVFHDDGIYLSTAKSLAQGHGYHLINLPGAPIQTKYPPLYPALLAMVWRIWPAFPDNVLAMQWLTLFLSACSVGLCYYYVVACGYFSRQVALIAGLLAASSHALLYYSSLLLSEMPFALFLCGALLALENYAGSERNSIGARLLLVVVVALPFLTRSIGLVLMPAAVLFLLVKRRFSWLVASGLGAVVAGWFAWTLLSHESSPNAYYYTSYWDWWRDYMSPATLARVAFFNTVDSAYSMVFSGSALAAKLVSFAPRLWPLLVLPAAPALPGLWRGLRRRQLLPWLLVFYFAMVIVWPWPPFRFVIPVLLFLLCYAIDGIGRLASRLTPEAFRRPLIVTAAGLLVIANVLHAHAVGAFNRSVDYPTMSTDWPSPVRSTSFLDAFAWIRTNTRPADVVAGYFDSMVYLYTGRKAVRPLVVTPASPHYGITVPAVKPGDLFRCLKNDEARYIFCTPFDRFGGVASLRRTVETIRTTRPGSMDLVYVGDDPRFAIFRVEAGGRRSSRRPPAEMNKTANKTLLLD